MPDAERNPEREDPSFDEWRPSLSHSIVWTVLTLVLSIAALAFLIYFNQSLAGSSPSFESTFASIDRQDDGSTLYTINLAGMGLVFGSIVAVLVLHEAIHGLMFRAFGGRPQYGAALHNGILPVLYCTAHGHLFSRRQFTVIVLAPAVLITAVGMALMAVTNFGQWLILPLALNFGGSVGDFWMAGMLARTDSETMIEDRKDGLRFHYGDEAHG